MIPQRISLYIVLIVLLVLGAFTALLLQGGQIRTGVVAGQAATDTKKDSGNERFDKFGLANASADRISQYVLSYLKNEHQVVDSEPQVLMSRRVTKPDVMALGLGCMGDFGTIEEPPLALVIMKGKFALSRGELGSVVHYVAYVFDLWADEPTYTVASIDGKGFRTVLGDLTLPIDDARIGSICPMAVPGTKTLHYGDTAPGFASPPPLPPEMRTAIVGMTHTPINVSTPLPIYTIPVPIETVVYPTLPPAP